MTKRRRENLERRRKHVEYAGYKIGRAVDPQAAFPWTLKQPTGRIIKHYAHEARAVTGAEKDIQKAILRHQTQGDLNEHWQGYVNRYLSYQS